MARGTNIDRRLLTGGLITSRLWHCCRRLMNNDDYEQIMLQKDFISNVEFLKEGNNIDVLFHADEGMPLSASLPLHVIN